MINTIVFDLDDTLYDEIDYCRSGFASVAEALANQLDSLPAEQIYKILWKQFTSGNHTKTFNAALDELNIIHNNQLIEDLVRIYRNHTPNIKLPQDSGEILGRLKTKYTLGLLTDGFLPAQRLKVRALGIEKYFKSILYTEELGRNCWKPSLVGFEKILKNLKTKSENTVYIADNEKKDFIAPNKLGFLTIQLIRPMRLHTSPCRRSNAAAKYIIHQMNRLPELLEMS